MTRTIQPYTKRDVKNTKSSTLSRTKNKEKQITCEFSFVNATNSKRSQPIQTNMSIMFSINTCNNNNCAARNAIIAVQSFVTQSKQRKNDCKLISFLSSFRFVSVLATSSIAMNVCARAHAFKISCTGIKA